MRRGLIAGFGLWLVAIALFRGTGGAHFDRSGTFLSTFLLSGLVAASGAALVCRLICTPGKVARFAVGLTIPGLLLHCATVMAFGTILPNLPAQAAAPYAALIMWAYALILSTIVLFGDRLSGPA